MGRSRVVRFELLGYRGGQRRDVRVVIEINRSEYGGYRSARIQRVSGARELGRGGVGFWRERHGLRRGSRERVSGPRLGVVREVAYRSCRRGQLVLARASPPIDFGRRVWRPGQALRLYHSALRQGQTAAGKLRDDHGDVVLAAALVGQIDQMLAGRLEIPGLVNDPRDLVLVNLSRQAVTANHQRVHVAKGQATDLDVHVAVSPQGLQDDVAVAVGFGLFFGDLPGVDQLLHQGLVFGGANDVIPADQISAAVADLPEENLIADRRNRGEGGAKPFVRGVGLALAVDQNVRLFD